jgi:hypothetical protein
MSLTLVYYTGVTAFLDSVRRLMFQKEDNNSETGSVSVHRWNGEALTHKIGPMIEISST